MKKFFTILLITSFFFACVPEDHVLEIEIVNNSLEPVKDIKVFTAGEKVSFEADNLPPGQEIVHTLQVPGNSADGQYTFRFKRKNGKEESATGSYLEERDGPLKKTLIFEIQESAVNVSQKALEVE